MSQNVPLPSEADPGLSVIYCQNCHSPMPQVLRFCRNCGYRMGEGTAEYTETVRLEGAVPTAKASPLTTPQQFPGPAPVPVYSASPRVLGAMACMRRRGRMTSGTSWIFVALVAFFAMGGVASVFSPRHSGIRVVGPAALAPPRSYLGVDDLNSTDGGVTFADSGYPGSPVDRAGMVGGDIITNFDGRAISDEDDLMELLKQTPIGKTVAVVYTRDGVAKTTMLTTISEQDLNQLKSAFGNRPEGSGRLGVNIGKTVPIPGTNLHGAEISRVDRSLPADMAGIKSGDVVIQFGDTPIRTEGELNARIRRAIPYSTVRVTIIRDGETMPIDVKVGSR
jgi:S1-C subfamily serine protease